jgi:hypothetical protein
MVTTGAKILEKGNCKESEISNFAKKHRTQKLKWNCKNSTKGNCLKGLVVTYGTSPRKAAPIVSWKKKAFIVRRLEQAGSAVGDKKIN